MADDGTVTFTRQDPRGVPYDQMPGHSFFEHMGPEHVEEFNRPAFGVSEAACGLWHAATELKDATLGTPVPLLNPKVIKKALFWPCHSQSHHACRPGPSLWPSAWELL